MGIQPRIYGCVNDDVLIILTLLNYWQPSCDQRDCKKHVTKKGHLRTLLDVPFQYYRYHWVSYGLGKKHGGLAKIWTVKVDSLDSGWLSCGALHGRPCNMFVLFLFHKIETHFSFSIHFCTYIWKMFVFHMILFESHPLILVLDPNVDGYISLTQLDSSYKSTHAIPY